MRKEEWREWSRGEDERKGVRRRILTAMLKFCTSSNNAQPRSQSTEIL